jgi:hypothetical protein
MGLTTLPPSMSRLPTQCGILNISQPYRPLRPVTGIAFLLLRDRVLLCSTIPFLWWGGKWKRVNYYWGPTTGLFYQLWMMVSVEQSVEWFAEKSELLGENLSQCRCVHPKSHMT